MARNYVTTLFDTLPGRHEGASFVDCDVEPSPTPTAIQPQQQLQLRQRQQLQQQQQQQLQLQQQQQLQQHLHATATPTATPATCGTGFAIGDLDAVVGNHVMFWGAQWWKNNHLSGGRAPASFKGFANCTNPNPPACGGTWDK